MCVRITGRLFTHLLVDILVVFQFEAMVNDAVLNDFTQSFV
jgi:hypothetical protein